MPALTVQRTVSIPRRGNEDRHQAEPIPVESLVAIPRRGNEDGEPSIMAITQVLELQSLVGAMRTLKVANSAGTAYRLQSLVGAMRTPNPASQVF
ncbi:hypothetical protein FrEUN1fDRAFT_5772 [Parafrankia sp. EUN1f]|nr:hypothetical protein FrEUN1fDRAFT_5772 [Parafrankia sp. EUN1f]